MQCDSTLDPGDTAIREDDRSVIHRAVSLLACFGVTSRPMTIGTLCSQTGLPPATVHRLVTRLIDSELVERPARGRYELGERLWRLGRGVNKISRIRDRVRPVLVDLHVGSSWPVILLSVDQSAQVVVIDQIAGSATWRPAPLDRALRAGVEDIFAAFEWGRRNRASTDSTRSEGSEVFRTRQRQAMIRQERVLGIPRPDGGTWVTAPVPVPVGSESVPLAVAVALPGTDPAAVHHARTRLLRATTRIATDTPRDSGDDQG